MEQGSVITGDLIGSTRLAPEATSIAMSALGDAAATLSRLTGTDARFTRFRGDGWQVFLPGRSHVLRAALLLMAHLRASGSGLTTRLSVGVGPITTLGTQDLSDAAGPAFTLSGRALDKMPHQPPHFAYSDPHDLGSWRQAVLDLALWQARAWTPEQAQAAAMTLTPPAFGPRPSDETLAKTLGISRQAFQSRIKGSGVACLTRALMAFESGADPAEI